MKIGILSDLHADTNAAALTETESFSSAVADLMMEKEIELLLLAGDNAGEAGASHELNEQIRRKSGKEVLFVPGNHDFWSRTNGITDTRRLYEEFARQPESLIQHPRILSDQWAVVGNPGWYDYGYGNHARYTEAQFEKKQYRFAYWNDAHYIHWDKSDRQIAEEMLEQLEADMQAVGDRQVILMTHIATHPEFVVPLPNKVYDYFNAFLGSSSYESLYRKYPIRYSIMGHVHFRKILNQNGTEYISACLGNKKHWIERDVRKELERTMVTIEI